MEEKKQKIRSIIRGNLVGLIASDQIDKLLANIMEDLERIESAESTTESLDNVSRETAGMAYR